MFDINKRGTARRAEDDPLFSIASSSNGAPRAQNKPGQVAVVGPSISVLGELRGKEDLLVQGTVNGSVQLQECAVTVGAEGKILGDIYARTVVIEGKVEGDLYGAEKVTIRSSGKVRGNIVAPVLSLEEGAQFKGMIDMEPDRAGAVFKQVRQALTVPDPISGEAEEPADTRSD